VDGIVAYWAVKHLLPLVSSFLNVALKSIRVQRFEKLETAEQLS
jgi:hypothetical protein